MSVVAVVDSPAVFNMSDRMFAVVTYAAHREALKRVAYDDGGEPLILADMEDWWLCADAWLIAAVDPGDIIEVEAYSRR